LYPYGGLCLNERVFMTAVVYLGHDQLAGRVVDERQLGKVCEHRDARSFKFPVFGLEALLLVRGIDRFLVGSGASPGVSEGAVRVAAAAAPRDDDHRVAEGVMS
jgi:hypothetical protein